MALGLTIGNLSELDLLLRLEAQEKGEKTPFALANKGFGFRSNMLQAGLEKSETLSSLGTRPSPASLTSMLSRLKACRAWCAC